MKRSQLTSAAMIALALALVLVYNLLGGPGEPVTDLEPTGGSVVLNLPDDGGDGPEEADTNPDDGTGTVDTSPGDSTPGDSTEGSPGTDLTNVDLGEDLELNEGITDKRAEQYEATQGVSVRRDGSYTSKVEVALYIHTYGTVPSNFISKTKARNAGWVNTEGNLWDVLPGMSIGGGGYYNESWDGEPLLPETPEGRTWHECDINYAGGYRGAERLVYSEDGLVFYTGDHYQTFERLY